jgi:hypothetical protein
MAQVRRAALPKKRALAFIWTMTSPEVRPKLLDALQLDLVGLWPGHAFDKELLPGNPNRGYLTGHLAPKAAPVEQRTDTEAKEEVAAAGDGGGADDRSPPAREALSLPLTRSRARRARAPRRPICVPCQAHQEAVGSNPRSQIQVSRVHPRSARAPSSGPRRQLQLNQ